MNARTRGIRRENNIPLGNRRNRENIRKKNTGRGKRELFVAKTEKNKNSIKQKNKLCL